MSTSSQFQNVHWVVRAGPEGSPGDVIAGVSHAPTPATHPAERFLKLLVAAIANIPGDKLNRCPI